MSVLLFGPGEYDRLSAELLDSDVEQCCVLFASLGGREEGQQRLIVRKRLTLESCDYSTRTNSRAILKPEVVANAATEARRENLCPVFVHTHPNTDIPVFSQLDAEGEVALNAFLSRRLPNTPAASLVIGNKYCSARLIPSGRPLGVQQVGSRIKFASEIAGLSEVPEFERQTRALGAEGQALISALTVAIVGLGGTGSALAQQLAYLGVRKFILMDPDTVEYSNLNRLVGATAGGVGRPKIEVVAGGLSDIAPNASFSLLQESVLNDNFARKLFGADFLFGCTDSHGSRAVINQLAYQYFLPTIDMGVAIATAKGYVTHVSGRVEMLSPGLGCLTCGDLLDAGEVRRDFMTTEERDADPYFVGPGVPQPAVISFNTTISSLAATMFLASVTSLPSMPRFLRYDALNGRTKIVEHSPRAGCVVCSTKGALGRGDLWPLPTRHSL